MAMILDAFVGKFAEKLLDLIQEPVVRLLGVEEDLQQLRWRLENIKNVLVDAERKRYNDMAIDAWIRQLKDVMYDADDAIDLWRIKLLSDFAASSSSSPPSKKVTYRVWIGSFGMYPLPLVKRVKKLQSPTVFRMYAGWCLLLILPTIFTTLGHPIQRRCSF